MDLGSIEFDIGAHHVAFEEPAQVSILLDGPLTVKEAEDLTAQVHSLADRHGPLYVCIGVEGLASTGTRVRQVFIEGNGLSYPARAAAIWGASFAVRIAMSMVLKASNRITPGRFHFPVEFFATESQARVWLAAQRAADAGEHRTPAELQPTGS